MYTSSLEPMYVGIMAGIFLIYVFLIHIYIYIIIYILKILLIHFRKSVRQLITTSKIDLTRGRGCKNTTTYLLTKHFYIALTKCQAVF